MDWKIPDGIDVQCVALCKALNLLPGIETFESCCGHGKDRYAIWFTCKRLRDLPALLYWFDGCHSGFYSWRVVARTDCAMKPVHFMIEGPVGAYKESEHIAALITEFVTTGEM